MSLELSIRKPPIEPLSVAIAVGSLLCIEVQRQDRAEIVDYLKVRSDVYETQEIRALYTKEDGRDMVDEDDERSNHYVVLEFAENERKVIATGRVITKTKQATGPLPTERIFPEAFNEPVPIGGSEISRLVIRRGHSNLSTLVARRVILQTLIADTLRKHSPQVIAEVEPRFSKVLRRSGIAVQALGAPKLVRMFGEVVPVVVDAQAMIEEVGREVLVSRTPEPDQWRYFYE